MDRRLSNIDRIKLQHKLTQQVKELLQRGEIDLENPFHFQIIVAILQKEDKQRTQFDLCVLAKALQSIKYFNEMSKTTSEDEMLNLYRELQYIYVPARRTLFRCGAIGRNFYIILRGSVWVLVGRSGLGDERLEKIDKQQDKKHKKRTDYDEGEESDEDEFHEFDDEKMLEHKYPNMMRVGKIEQGGSFGEIALTNQLPRQATIVCAENCQFIKLSREAFNKFLSEYYVRIQNKNFEFLKSISIFRDWQDADVSLLQYHFQTFEYSMNTVLYREGEPIKGVYFLISGQVELQQKSKISENNKRYQQTKQIAISRYDVGQVFGFMEILQEQNQRITKAVCLTEKVKTLFLEADRFKLYCCQGDSLIKLQKMMKKLQQNIDKANNMYLEALKQSSQSLSIYLAENDTYLQRLKTENQPVCKTNRSRVIKRSLDILGNVSHKSSKILNYCECVSSFVREPSNKLNLDNPLIQLELSKRVKMQQLQFQLLYSPNPPPTSRVPQFSSGDSRQTLLRQLKLPSIFNKQPSEQDDRISIRQLDPVL